MASALVGVAADSAGSKITRRVLFWGVAIPLLPFAVVGIFGWWTIGIGAGIAAFGAAVWAVMRVFRRHVLIEAPASLRAALPAAAPRRAYALPRGWAIARARRALPATQKALPAPERVITGQVVAAPAKRAVR